MNYAQKKTTATFAATTLIAAVAGATLAAPAANAAVPSADTAPQTVNYTIKKHGTVQEFSLQDITGGSVSGKTDTGHIKLQGAMGNSGLHLSHVIVTPTEFRAKVTQQAYGHPYTGSIDLHGANYEYSGTLKLNTGNSIEKDAVKNLEVRQAG